MILLTTTSWNYIALHMFIVYVLGFLWGIYWKKKKDPFAFCVLFGKHNAL